MKALISTSAAMNMGCPALHPHCFAFQKRTQIWGITNAFNPQTESLQYVCSHFQYFLVFAKPSIQRQRSFLDVYVCAWKSSTGSLALSLLSFSFVIHFCCTVQYSRCSFINYSFFFCHLFLFFSVSPLLFEVVVCLMLCKSQAFVPAFVSAARIRTPAWSHPRPVQATCRRSTAVASLCACPASRPAPPAVGPGTLASVATSMPPRMIMNAPTLNHSLIKTAEAQYSVSLMAVGITPIE